MHRREFLKWMGLGAACAAGARWIPQTLLAQATAPAGKRKPNIVVILADDLGYADTGFQGLKDIPTPHIDQLAAGGMRFTNAYVSAPVCGPSRAGLVTGRYQNRFGLEFNAHGQHDPGMELKEKTIADVLKSAGYATGIVGKWHLGDEPEYHPLSRGFDEFFGFLGGMHDFIVNEQGTNFLIQRGRQKVAEKQYLTDAFAREAVDFIGRHKDEPFFLYLSFNAVHAPLESLAKYTDRFPTMRPGKRRTYAGMLSAMDDAVGAVTAQLRKTGVEQDTLVIFLSDNGGPTPETTSRNTPLRGYKKDLFEGGIRVPMAAAWKGRIAPGSVCHDPVTALDIVPTAAALAGAAVSAERPVDGVDLTGVLAGGAAPDRPLYWRFGSKQALRQGKWKYVREGQGPAMLFDLDADVGETTNLADKHPEILARLQEQFGKFDAQMEPPRFGKEPPPIGRSAKWQEKMKQPPETW